MYIRHIYKNTIYFSIINIGSILILFIEKFITFIETKEMFLGTREPFIYFECETCHCLQISQIPTDLYKYYTDSYYSFEPQQTGHADFPPADTQKYPEKILDVGCGSGKWLIERAMDGYDNLCGCDPFIEKNINYGNRITIKRCTLHEMSGEYDIITFNDSFEHMDDPLEELLCVKKLLAPTGICRIHIPIYPNIAQETFGNNWYQWDAPRHLFIHSRKSMELLCEKADLCIKKVDYNSNATQFIISYCYTQGISMMNIPADILDTFPADEKQAFDQLAQS